MFHRHSSRRRTRLSDVRWPLALCIASLAVGCDGAPDNTDEGEADEVVRRSEALTAPGTESESLASYAARCDLATGIHVPAFNCDTGTEVPGQSKNSAGKCAEPNVLNQECDPGSRFQILPGRTPDAVAVAHCRKRGAPLNNSIYRDIAVIQYNKRNGAVCFYQALGADLDGASVAAPSAGESAWRWQTPRLTESQGCTACHDNGALIRSRYLAQLSILPSTADGYDNLTTPVAYVGTDFGTNRSWSISTASASGDTGLNCNTCHRMAVSNSGNYGTAGHYGIVATAATQANKIAHTLSHPIWMRPGQGLYGTCSVHSSTKCNLNTDCPSGETCVSSGADATAQRYKACADGFWQNQSPGFENGTPTAGCSFTPLGKPWAGFAPAQLASLTGSYLVF